MSRGYRFAVVGTLWLFAFVLHYVGVAMFAPDGALWGMADGAISTGFIDSNYRPQQYKIFAQYVPLLVVGFSVAWLFFSEYEAQTTTTRTSRRRRR